MGGLDSKPPVLHKPCPLWGVWRVLAVFSQKYSRTNERRTAVQMGGVLLGSLSSRLRSQEGPAIQKGGRTAVQIGGVLPYFLRDEYQGKKQTHKHKQFAGLSRDWAGGKYLFMWFFFG